MKRLTRHVLAATTVATLLGGSLAEARTYRYTDENGRPVISNTVPQEAAKRGYEILNQQGRVIDRVEPAPTAEEIAERKARKQREKERARQRELDRQLLKRFSHPDDAVRAMHRKIQELQGLNQLKRGNISVIENQLEDEQTRAANTEREGREVPDAVLEKIRRLQAQIDEIEHEIAAQNQDIEKIRAEYLKDIRRLETLTGDEHSIPLKKPSPGREANQTANEH